MSIFRAWTVDLQSEFGRNCSASYVFAVYKLVDTCIFVHTDSYSYMCGSDPHFAIQLSEEVHSLDLIEWSGLEMG